MIPLYDTIRHRHFPIVNTAIIGLCALGFWLELRAGSELGTWLETYALIPARLSGADGSRAALDPGPLRTLITSMFLHGGWLHLLGNMLFLWIFGDNVEDRLGHLGYAVFYLLGGIAAGLAHVAMNPDSAIPTVGASGSIAAVMGAYLLLHPRARIVSLIIVFFFVRRVAVPASVYLLVWFAHQLLVATASLGGNAAAGGVAWWAHAGGFLFGAATILVLGRGPSSVRPR